MPRRVPPFVRRAPGRERGGWVPATRTVVTDAGQLVEATVATLLGAQGRSFASKKEARRYVALTLLVRAGQIRDLACQVRLPLHAATATGPVLVGHYVADFAYTLPDGTRVLEDVKGAPRRTDLYTWKRKHVLVQHGVAIHEV